MIALAVGAVAARQAIPQATGPNVARDLRGAIDIHVHANPDKVPRSLDGLEAARLAKDKGMRAIVLKSHYDPTAGLAWLARKAVPGIEVFGGIDLNLPVGGMNAHAVENMVQVNGGWGRMVWMSTFDSENQVRTSKSPNAPFVRVSQNGALLPETKAVIAAIRKHNLVLASGHVSAQEALMMFEEGQRLGVRGMVATHGMSAPTSLTVEQAQQAARLGAFIEFVSGTLANAERAGENRSYRRRHPKGRRRARDPLVRSRSGRQSAAGRWLRDVHGGAAQERVHRSGDRSDGQAESRAAAGPPIDF